MTLADFTAYSSIQSEIEALYRDPLEWNRKAVLNVANSGYFSSDRSIQDYLDNIWHTSRWPDYGASRRCSSVAVPLYRFLRCA